MKTTKLQTTVAFGLAAFFLLAPHADGQGFFGWKKKPKASQEESSNLFPETNSPGYVSTSAPSAPRDIAIFKSGQPENVRETKYLIKDGVRVPAPKRRSFFKRNPKPTTTAPPAPPAPPVSPTPNRPDSTPYIASVTPPPNSGGSDHRKGFPLLRTA